MYSGILGHNLMNRILYGWIWLNQIMYVTTATVQSEDSW